MKTTLLAVFAALMLTTVAFAMEYDSNNEGQGYTQDQLVGHLPHKKPNPPQYPNYPYPQPQYPNNPYQPQYPNYPYPGYNNYGGVCRNGAYWCPMNYAVPVGTPCACVYPNWYFYGTVTNW